MNPIRTSLFTGAGVTLAALSVVYGSYVRECLDTGGSVGVSYASASPTLGLEASTRQIPEDDFYRGLVLLLRREYVEPITDERKLAIGAVKGMVESLKDPRATFMDPDEFRAYNDAVAGKYEGIGVDLAYMTDSKKGAAIAGQADDTDAETMSVFALPRLTVVAVTSGGPAQQAGVKPGDWVESVEDHWVLNPDPVKAYREAVDSIAPDALKKVSPDEAKKRQANARAISADLHQKLDTMIMPLKARDLLTIGDEGSIKIVWHRGDTLRTTEIARKRSEVPVVDSDAAAIALRFVNGASTKLKQAIEGKSNITFDLRDNSNGDFKAMRQCLALVAPAGTYGTIRSEKAGKSHAFTIPVGNEKPPKMTILVDRSTRGAAGIFASALASRKLAKLVGTPSSDRAVIETVPLPDGSGYNLPVGEYLEKAPPTPNKVAMRSHKQPSITISQREPDGSIVAMLETGGHA